MKTILIQLDTDPQPSSFDRVVAVDADVDELFSYGGVTPENVEPLVHGAMFTRGPKDLQNTAIFIGGSDVAAGEALLEKVTSIFFGPMRVSVMMDSNGSNTTAAAAVLAAGQHLKLASIEALVLGGTGPVGQRAAQLLAMQGARVRVASRSLDRARSTCDSIQQAVEDGALTPVEISSDEGLQQVCAGVELIISAGAAGREMLPAETWQSVESLQVAIDLNAVPPAGLPGIEATDKAAEKHGAVCYGAVGVGGTKMKIHKTALNRLFAANDQVFETTAIYRIGEEMQT